MIALISAILTFFSISAIIPEDVLDGKLTMTDKRFATFKLAMDIMRARGHQIVIETGTARRGDKSCATDGCSTVLFGKWTSSNLGMTFLSVDNDPLAIEAAVESTWHFNSTQVILSDSVAFLKSYPQTIDFLYLDSMDFDNNNPRPAQELALREIVAAYPKLHEDSVVMVDDCGMAFGGKCTYVEVFLKELGWRTLLKSYQLIMVTPKTVSI